MRKNYFGRQFKRDANERKALFKNLLTSLVLEERITTTPAKAKSIKAAADKLVTKAKIGGPVAFAKLAPDVRYVAVEKLVNQIAPLFATRQGGYTRIIKVGRRVADNAPQVIMEWVERPVKVVSATPAKVKKVAKPVKAEKKEAVKATIAVAKPEKSAKATKSSAPKQMVTRQKKG